jgi:hypothetical protein
MNSRCAFFSWTLDWHANTGHAGTASLTLLVAGLPFT